MCKFNLQTHKHVDTHMHIYMLHQCSTGDRGRRLLPWYQVAGLSDTMVRSCPAARPERAEQWSRSADGAAEGTTRRSVSLAELHGLLQPQTLSSLHTMESGRSRAGGNGGEFPACYNKMESSILVTEAIGQSWATPRIHHNFQRLQ